MTHAQLIQPTGFHLRLSDNWLVSAASANISDFLPVVADQALGRPLTDILGDDSIHDIRNRMALLRSEEAVEHLLRMKLGEGPRLVDLSIFRLAQGYGIDAEPSDNHSFGDATAIVEGMIARMSTSSDAATIANEAARQFRALTGFDRVLIVGEGRVIGKSLRPGQDDHELWLGDLDCCPLAITDSEAAPIEILAGQRTGSSNSTLRIATDLEARMLASQHARAALILPLQRDGRNWGHIGCYHGSPRHVGVERRSVASLFARFIALQIEVAELKRS